MSAGFLCCRSFFLFVSKKQKVYDVHMNACIPEIYQSGREMQGTWLASNIGILVFELIS